MNKKRNRLEIIKDILEVIKTKNGRIKPTHILYKSNLSYQMMEEYLSELIKKEFIVQIKNGKSKSYFITQKGQDYLSQYKLISEFTQSFGLNED
jgi:predicted transcriptional regulator